MSDTTAAVPTTALPLPGGGRMPLVGFGTWRLLGQGAVDATRWALAAGYRHLDTATMYANQGEVGQALRDSGVPRDDVFVTTKLPPDRVAEPRAVLEESLTELGLDQVDLWLVHWPPPGDDTALWRDFVAARDEGAVRDIGVSNYSLEQVDRLVESVGVLPAVNQVPWSPLSFDRAVLDGHRARGVVLEGYSTLRGGTLTHPVVVAIAARLGRTPAQVLVRWHVQHEVVVIPRSSQRERVVANADVDGFALSAADMAALDALGVTPA